MATTIPFIEAERLPGSPDAPKDSTPFLTSGSNDQARPLAEVIFAKTERKQPDVSELEALELAREDRLRSRALSVAGDIPIDDESWRVLNKIRNQLIEKEVQEGLTDVDEIFLGTFEVVCDRRLERSGALNLDKADRILRELKGE